jgi:NADH:ubiquinone oxidoreductase subunit 6 (subunit J)
MDITYLFYFFSVCAIGAGISAVYVRQVVYASVWLMATLLSVGGLAMLAGSMLIGSVFCIVSVSTAVMVMMVGAGFFSERTRGASVWNNQWLPALIAACTLCGMLVWLICRDNRVVSIAEKATVFQPPQFSVWLMESLALPIALLALALFVSIAAVIRIMPRNGNKGNI